MSTKIYTAWRIPLPRFAEATDVLHSLLAEDFYEDWTRILEIAYKKNKPTTEDQLFDLVLQFERKFADTLKTNFYNASTNLNRGFCFWLDANYAYIIPYGTWNLNTPEWFEDFHYQNQTDRDENIPEAEWLDRAAKWNELWIGIPQDRQYVHKVVDLAEGFYLATSIYTRRWVDEKREVIKKQNQQIESQPQSGD